MFKHEGIEFCILLCFIFIVYSIIKRVKSMSYVSCNYREQFEFLGRAETERDGTRAETRFGCPAKRTSPFKSAGVSVQSSAGRRGVRISRSNAG